MIRYQADSLIPTQYREANLTGHCWALHPKTEAKVEVLLSSVMNDFVESRLDTLESIGLNVIAFEPRQPGTGAFNDIARNHLPEYGCLISQQDDRHYYHHERGATVDALHPDRFRCHSPGRPTKPQYRREKQAQQFVFKFGLGKDKLEGQIYNAIIGTVELLMSDIDSPSSFSRPVMPIPGLTGL